MSNFPNSQSVFNRHAGPGGVLSSAQFYQVAKELNLNYSFSECFELYKKFDVDNSFAIEFPEFQKILDYIGNNAHINLANSGNTKVFPGYEQKYMNTGHTLGESISTNSYVRSGAYPNNYTTPITTTQSYTTSVPSTYSNTQYGGTRTYTSGNPGTTYSSGTTYVAPTTSYSNNIVTTRTANPATVYSNTTYPTTTSNTYNATSHYTHPQSKVTRYTADISSNSNVISYNHPTSSNSTTYYKSPHVTTSYQQSDTTTVNPVRYTHGTTTTTTNPVSYTHGTTTTTTNPVSYIHGTTTTTTNPVTYQRQNEATTTNTATYYQPPTNANTYKVGTTTYTQSNNYSKPDPTAVFEQDTEEYYNTANAEYQNNDQDDGDDDENEEYARARAQHQEYVRRQQENEDDDDNNEDNDDEEMPESVQFFSRFDVGDKSYLTKEELYNACSELGVKCETEEELDSIFDEIDNRKTGFIQLEDFDEFYQYVTSEDFST